MARVTTMLGLAFLVGESRAGEDLQARIDAAVEAGERVVVIPPGEHRLDRVLRLDGLTGFSLQGEGARLVFTNLRDGGILATDCAGLELKGFTIDFDPLPFTQGTVDRIDPATREVFFTLHEGYPDLAPHFLGGRAHVFSAETHNWKTSAPDIYASKAEALTPRNGVLRFTPGKREEFGAFAVGDYVALDFRHARGVRVERCSDLRIDGVTFWSAPSIAVIARFMGGRNVFSYKIGRGPTPAGATVPRLMSTSADGLNYAYARSGPIIENCDFSHMGDDSVNLHGIAFFVGARKGRDVYLLRPYAEEPFGSVIAAGDDVHGLAADSFGVKGRSRVRSFSPEKNPPEDFAPLAAKTWRSVAVSRKHLSVYRLELEDEIDVESGDFIEIPAIAAPGYVIRNNRFADHRARALRLMSSNGQVEGNTIEGIKQAAITIGPEFTFHREAGWVSDVSILANTIRGCGFDPSLQRSGSYTPGAISVFHRGETVSAPKPETRHERILIQGNVIEDSGGPAIHINQARDVRVSGNRIGRANLVSKPGAGSSYGLTTDRAVVADNSIDVSIE